METKLKVRLEAWDDPAFRAAFCASIAAATRSRNRFCVIGRYPLTAL